MNMFSNCSGPCETCRIYNSGAICLAGYGDDDYTYVSPKWITEHTEERLGKQRGFVERHRLPLHRPVV